LIVLVAAIFTLDEEVRVIFVPFRVRFDPLVISNTFDAVEIAIVPAPSDRKIIVPPAVGAACIRIEPVCVTFKSPLLPT
jgi:hypothetical protein